jgi:hypothetical protein
MGYAAAVFAELMYTIAEIAKSIPATGSTAIRYADLFLKLSNIANAQFRLELFNGIRSQMRSFLAE